VRAIMGGLRDIKSQQTTLGISLIHLKKQVLGPGDSTSALHAPNPPEPPAPATGNASVAPPSPGAVSMTMPGAG
jgi:hypothetical protein